MIVLCDADGVVDMTPAAISRRTGIPIEHIKAGIEILEGEDPYSRTPDEEGRRIKRLGGERPWGWYIVNHEKYRKFQDADTIREQNRERKRKQREKGKSPDVTDGHGPSRMVTNGHGQSRGSHEESRHTNTDTNTKPLKDIGASAAADTPTRGSKSNGAGKPEYPPEFEETWAEYPMRAGGDSKKDAFKAWRASVNRGHDPETILAGLLRYRRFLEETGKVGSEYVKRAKTFFGPGDHFLGGYEIPASMPSTDEEWEQAAEELGMSAGNGESWPDFRARVRQGLLEARGG